MMMPTEAVKNTVSVAGYAGTTLIGFAVDNVTGIVAAVVGGVFIGISIALPRALPALKSAGNAWLEYCANRDTNKLEAWKANEAAHLAARLAEDEKMRPTLTVQLEALKEQAAKLVQMLDQARAEAKEAKEEAKEAKELAAHNNVLTREGTERAVRHTDANKANIERLTQELARRESLIEAEAGTHAIVSETAESVRKIEGVIIPRGDNS